MSSNSVCNNALDQQIDFGGCPILLVTSMIIARVGLNSVILPLKKYLSVDHDIKKTMKVIYTVLGMAFNILCFGHADVSAD